MPMPSNDLSSRLHALADPAYRLFQCKLMPTVPTEQVWGVRTPQLRALAKEAAGTPEAAAFLAALPHAAYDENNLHGALLCLMRDYDACLAAVEVFLPYIDNWAINDSTCSNLKQFKKQQIEGFSFIRKCLKEKNPYIIRFGLVLLLNYYINDQYIDIVLKICEHDYLDHYYVSMAHSWLISMCYIKYPNKTYSFLQETNINSWVYHKAISKICDSKRISREAKEKLRKLR